MHLNRRILMATTWVFFLLFLCACSSGESSQPSVDNSGTIEKSAKTDITVKVNGLQAGKCFINGMVGKQLYSLDSLRADKNGEIEIKRDSLIPGGLYYIVLPDRKTFVQMILAEDQEFELETNLNAIVEDMEVRGSIDNQLFYENMKYEQKHNADFQAINLNAAAEGTPERKKLEDARQKLLDERAEHIKEITSRYPNSFFSKFKIAGQNPELKDFRLANGELDNDKQVWHYRNEFWDNVDFTDERLLRTPVYHNKLERYIKKLTPQIGDSIVKYADWVIRKSESDPELFKYTVNYIALEYEESSIMDWEKIYVHLVENFFTYEKAFWSDSTNIYRLHQRARQMKPSLLGQIGQDFTARNLEGGKTSLYDLKSDFIVLFIYTTTCEHCQKESPGMVQMYNKWKNKGVDVYALCIDEDEGEWRKFVQRYGFPWKHNTIDPENESGFRFKYNVDITPEIYVLDRDRRIVGKNLKAFQVETILQRHM